MKCQFSVKRIIDSRLSYVAIRRDHSGFSCRAFRSYIQSPDLRLQLGNVWDVRSRRFPKLVFYDWFIKMYLSQIQTRYVVLVLWVGVNHPYSPDQRESLPFTTQRCHEVDHESIFLRRNVLTWKKSGVPIEAWNWQRHFHLPLCWVTNKRYIQCYDDDSISIAHLFPSVVRNWWKSAQIVHQKWKFFTEVAPRINYHWFPSS